jgi:hypothetical protein
MKLSDKIESIEDYLTAVAPTGDRMRDLRAANGRFSLWRSLYVNIVDPTSRTVAVSHVSNVAPHQWWMHREDARQHHRVYDPPTSVLMELHNCANFSQYFLHISTKDPTQIAYTPSHADGCVDRQVHMALGRFLRKYSLTLSDNEVAALEARHRSELSPDVKLHSFIDEWDACLNVYKNVNSCMAKDESVFRSDIHPVAMYKAPGYHLAVLYNDRGKAAARCVVYINPNDETDKRWVRVYGDVVLYTWLRKNNFQAKPLTGTYLYTHKLPDSGGDGVNYKARILMAYLDPGSERSASLHNGPVIWDGGNKLYVLPKAYDPTRYPKAFVAQSTGGYLDAFMTPVEVTSLISGKSFNAMEQQYEHVWVGGKRGFALKSEITGFFKARVTRADFALVPPDTPLFTYNATSWLDTADLRMELGFMKLSPRHYPDAQEWISPEQANLVVRTPEGYIRKEDVVFLIIHKELRKIHQASVQEGCERVASIDEVKTYAAPGEQVVRTTANRRVVPGVHQVVQLYNGEWMYERHTSAVEVFGTRVFVPKDAPADVLKNIGLPQAVRDNIAVIARTNKRNDAVVRRVIYEHLMNRGDVFVPIAHVKAESRFEWSYVWSASEVVVEPIRALLAASEPTHVGAIQAAVDNFKTLASLLIAEIDRVWAEKTAAETTETA